MKSIFEHFIHETIELFKVRSIITFIITFGLTWGFMTDRIGAEIFVPFATMVFGYYFNKRQSPDFEWKDRKEDRARNDIDKNQP